MVGLKGWKGKRKALMRVVEKVFESADETVAK